MDEKPQIDEKPETKPEEKTIDIDGLMQQLEAANITDPEKLKGKLSNAVGFDRVQSERDQLANELMGLRQQMSEFNKQPKREDYDYDQPQSIDLAGEVRKALKAEREEEAKQRYQAQQQYVAAYNKITKNPRYKLIKKEFEEKIGDPMTQFAIQNGQINPVEMFNDMLVEHFQGLAMQAAEAFKTLKGTDGVKPLHVESGAKVSADKVKVPTDKDKKIEQIKERGRRGKALHEDEQDMIIMQELGDLFLNK